MEPTETGKTFSPIFLYASLRLLPAFFSVTKKGLDLLPFMCRAFIDLIMFINNVSDPKHILGK